MAVSDETTTLKKTKRNVQKARDANKSQRTGAWQAWPQQRHEAGKRYKDPFHANKR